MSVYGGFVSQLVKENVRVRTLSAGCETGGGGASSYTISGKTRWLAEITRFQKKLFPTDELNIFGFNIGTVWW